MSTDAPVTKRENALKRAADQISNHPFVSLLMVIITIVSFVFLFPPLFQGPEKHLVYEMIDTAIFSTDNLGIDGVRSANFDEQAALLVATNIRIMNDGLKPIIAADIPSMSPLKVTFSEPHHIMNVELVSSSNAINNVQVQWHQGVTAAILTFEYLNPKDEFTVQILQSEPSLLGVDVTIIGMDDTEPSITASSQPTNNSESSAYHWAVRMVFALLACIIFVIVSFKTIDSGSKPSSCIMMLISLLPIVFLFLSAIAFIFYAGRILIYFIFRI